ncbi:LPS-assembly protein LptD [Novosphingopyxis sp.]|uniref:LPS-assembly protein LptD n=1 Tax=Novosphingopyxis sp. TaxID=2709690 RepID=UPI003B58DB60
MRSDKTGHHAAARGLALAFGLIAAVPVAAQQSTPEEGAFDAPEQPIPPVERPVDETAAEEPAASKPASADAASSDEVGFAADELSYDTGADVVTASGNVELARDGYRVFADQIRWDRGSGQVVASGAVRAVNPNGDIAYGDTVTLSDSLRDGAIDNLLLVLKEGGRLAAVRGERFDDGVVQLERAAYTPCAVVDSKGCPKDPSWQVNAVRVTYDPNRRRVSYSGARIELFGLPIIPLPGLSHPLGNGTEGGLLVPNIGYTNNNGAELQLPYLIALGPDRDVVVTPYIYSRVLPMVSASYRELNELGAYQVTGYATYSRQQSISGDADSRQQFRGYLDASGELRPTEHWTLSGSIRRATDRTFLRRYDISRDDRLRSTLQAERIDANSYFRVAGWAVQTLRVDADQGMVPLALPEIDYRRKLDDPLLGGKIMLQANSLAIGRSEGQDTQRAFAAARWDKRLISDLGQLLTFSLLARGDIYHSSDNDLTDTLIYRGEEGFQSRFIATAAADASWPFIGEAFGGTQIITPRVQFVATPSVSNFDVPNEDSRAVELEDLNLFSLNRFPGYDRYEDGYRVVYGMDYSLITDSLSVQANIGQSYRLSNEEVIFPDGTGLSQRLSDIVGRTDVRYENFVRLTHRYRLDKDSFKIRRNEIDATIGSTKTYAQIGYLRLNRDIASSIEDLRDREELRAAGRIAFARYWSVFGSAIVDLTDADEDPLADQDGFQPIRHRLGIAYDDECLSIGLTWRRDYEAIGDARRGNSFLFRLAFRNLGV